MSESRISSIIVFFIVFFELKDFWLAEFKQERGFWPTLCYEFRIP